MGSSSSDFDVIISSSTGFLKGLSVCSQNLSSISLIKNENISAMCWCGPFGSEIFVGCHSGRLYRIDVKRNSVTFVEEFSKSHEDSVVALQSYDKSIFVAHTSGDITLFTNNLASELRLRSSGSICSAKLAANQIATGGKESALRVWDVNNHNEPIFTAKNVRSSVLELSVPIWIADVSFVPKSNGKLVLTASRYGELDIYDLRCGQRRPVARHAWRTSRKHGKLHVGSGKHSAVLPDLTTTRPITKAIAYDNSPGVGLRVVAGNAVGELSVLDLRLPPGCSSLNSSYYSGVVPIKSYGSRAPEPPSGVRCLSGASGCITQIMCGGADEEYTSLSSARAIVNSEPIIIASSLDRYLRVYNRDTGKRLGKVFLSLLNVLL
ncbi:WD repeat-containing protein 74 [Schistosoma japonicum]|nr:WD repeat-containing protein 74 [Schistosoma japonicum]